MTEVKNVETKKAPDILKIATLSFFGIVLAAFILLKGIDAVSATPQEDPILTKLETTYSSAVLTREKNVKAAEEALAAAAQAKVAECHARDALRAYKVLEGFQVQDDNFSCGTGGGDESGF